MVTNIVCSDTYLDAFSKLDKKTQKKALETIRLMQRSLRSDSLKIEKLGTKLDFKSARVTQDFRVIFTQAGNTVLLVYIDHHDDAYQWAARRLQGFDAVSAKPAYEYFEQSKIENFDSLADGLLDLSDGKEAAEVFKNKKTDVTEKPIYDQENRGELDGHASVSSDGRNPVFGFLSKVLIFFAGIIVGVIVSCLI